MNLEAQASQDRVISVQFTSGGDPMVGRLFLPDTFTHGQRVPAVVITGAWMTVKEQMPMRYAQEMARRGFASLIFDFRGWGESGGARRQRENPTEKTEDILAAVEYLATRPEVDAERLGGFGVSADLKLHRSTD